MNRISLKSFVTIISSGRPENVSNMRKKVGPATWIVGKGEEQAYRDAGAIKVIEGGGLTESRNLALKLAFANNLNCIQLDDDLEKIEFVISKEETKEVNFSQAVKYMLRELDNSDYKLAGVATTTNLYFFHKAFHYDAFIIGCFLLIKKCPLLFDEGLTLKEDYDYTLQHCEIYGGVLRCNRIMPHFKHYTNKGGVVEYRNPKTEQKNIKRLKQKWPKFVKDNSKRENEILIRWKKDEKD